MAEPDESRIDMDNGISKECATCGGLFVDETRGRNRRYCDRRCWRRAKGRRERGSPERDTPTVSHCPVCGTSLAGRKHGTRYCTDACYQRARRRDAHGQPVADPEAGRTCIRCGAAIKRSHWTTTRFCSRNCCYAHHAYERYYRLRPVLIRACLACGKTIPPTANLKTKYCDSKCAGRCRSQEVIDRYVNARRAFKASVLCETFNKREIYERDRWICGICGHKVNKLLTFPHPKSPSLDHVIPLSQGGDHTRANTRLAHFGCNSGRGNRGTGDQLALIG